MRKLELQRVFRRISKTLDVMCDGKSFRVYSIGWLAALTSNAAVTLRLWERQGVLPKPCFRIQDGRWYTAMELEVYSKLINQHYQAGRNKMQLKVQLHTAAADVKKAYQRGGALTPKLAIYSRELEIAKIIQDSLLKLTLDETETQN